MRPQLYFSLLRIDNWTKNLLILAGVALAYLLAQDRALIHWRVISWVFLSLCLASSANYTINETADAHCDLHHPIKKNRASVQHSLSMRVIIAQYTVLAGISFAMAYHVGTALALLITAYLLCGVLYNLPPLRLKDIAYADIALEAVNYPIRIIAGWLCMLPQYLPPSSLLILAWALGGFMMSVKRLAEYQLFSSPKAAGAYRKSYRSYDLTTLVCTSVFCAILSAFCIAVFLLKYHIEFVLALPLISLWFVWYLALGISRNENTIYPERLFRQRNLMLFSVGILMFLLLLSRVEWPLLHRLTMPLYFK